jgi:hypothetical protein
MVMVVMNGVPTYPSQEEPPPMPPSLSPMQVSVMLPPLLMEGLADNYVRVRGKKASFTALFLYALNELWADLADEAGLAAAGIVLPKHDPAYTVGANRSARRASDGFYSVKIPESFRPKWEELLKSHDNNGPAIVYRAMLSLYRTIRSYHIENEKDSLFPKKYPPL